MLIAHYNYDIAHPTSVCHTGGS